MSVSLKKQTPIMREITPVHLIDEEETIVKPTYRPEPAVIREITPVHLIDEEETIVKPEALKVEVLEDKQLPQVAKKENLSRSDWIEIIVKSALICGAFAFALFGFILPMANDFSGVVSDISYQEAAIKSVYDGIIVDKSIENPRSNAFRTTNTEYRLYIGVDYYVDGEKKTTKKYFSVPEATYLAYDIGDYFNSHNFSFSDGQ